MTDIRTFSRRCVNCAALAIFFFLCGELMASPQSPDASDQKIAKSIEGLGSNKFRVRQLAFQNLVRGGKSAIDALEQGANTDNLEVGTRCLEALLQMANDKDCLQPVISALERLAAEPNNPIAKLAGDHVTKLKMTDEDRAVAALTAAGVRIFHGPDGKVFSVTITDDRQTVWLKHLGSLYSLRITGNGVTDRGIENLVDMPKLSDLSILRSSVTDTGLANLQDLAGLRSIRLSMKEFTANGLRALQNVPTLERISLTSVEEDALEALAEIRQIDNVHLSDLRVTAQTIRLLNQLTNLKRASVSVANVDDEQMRLLGKIAVPTDLSLSGSPTLTEKSWKQLHNARLIGITISRCPITDTSLASIGQLILLETLSIRDAKITDLGLIHLKSLRALRSLHLTDVDVTQQGIDQLREALPNLAHASVRKRGAVAPRPIRAIPRINVRKDPIHGWTNAFIRDRLTADVMKQLKQESELGTVFLTGGKATNEDLALISDLPTKGLVIHSKHVTDEGIKSLENHPTLESLGLWSSTITDEALKSIARMSSLTKLTIHEVPITDSGMEKLISRMSESGKIETLNLFRCNQLTDQGLMRVGELKSLEQLFLNNNGGLTSAIFEGISQLTSLTRLEIDDVSLNQSDLAHLATLSKLETLGISRSSESTMLNEEGLKHLSRLKSLQSLTMQNADIDDKSIAQITKLTDMQRLGLSGTRITDEGVAKLAKELPGLLRLGLSGTEVTDAGMEHVGKLKQLEWLWLDNTAVGDEGLGQLGDLTKLKYIYVNNENVTSEGHREFQRAHPETDIQLK